jgi:hypothetical protein
MNHLDRTGLSYIFEQTRFSAFLGLGASVERTIYFDPETGETKELWNAGFGAGLPGIKLTHSPMGTGISTGTIPNESVSIQTHIGSGTTGGFGELNLSNRTSSLGGSLGTPIAGPYASAIASSNGSVTAVGGIGAGIETSGTLNIRFKKGALGDWFFDKYVQPYYDARDRRMTQEHRRRMAEIQARQQSWQDFLREVNLRIMSQASGGSK